MLRALSLAAMDRALARTISPCRLCEMHDSILHPLCTDRATRTIRTSSRGHRTQSPSTLSTPVHMHRLATSRCRWAHISPPECTSRHRIVRVLPVAYTLFRSVSIVPARLLLLHSRIAGSGRHRHLSGCAHCGRRWRVLSSICCPMFTVSCTDVL